MKRKKTIILYCAWVAMFLGISTLAIILFYQSWSPAIPDAEPYITGKFLICAEEKSSEDQCLRVLAGDILNFFSIQTILSVLGKYETRDQSFLEKCHSLAHFVGRELYDRTKNVSGILSEATPDCLGGVFHGAVEGYFREHSLSLREQTEEKLKKIVSDICGRREDFKTEWEYGLCFHGLGHALMYFTVNDLPRALQLCDYLKEEGTKKLICFDGALMENVDSLSSNTHPSRYIKADDPYFPCTILGSRYQGECYTYGLSHRFQSDTPKSFEVCAGAPAVHLKGCIRLTGLHVVMAVENPKKILEKCSNARYPDFAKECILGAAASLATRFGFDSELPSSLCQLVSLDQKSECYQTVVSGLRLRASDDEKIDSLCRKISEEKYHTMCLTQKWE